MRQILSSFLCLHWAAAFGTLAFVCVGGTGGVENALELLGIPAGSALSGIAGPGLAVSLGVALLLVAVLFCWASVELFIGDPQRPQGTEAVLKAAFAGAGLLLSATLVAGAAGGVDGALTAVAIQLTALAACYLACVGERLGNMRLAAIQPDDSRETARAMALGAARVYTLPRSVGLPDGGGR